MVFTFEDPLRWAETFLFEPDSGDPYRFWDYQRPSMRAWMQDVIHQDGAECGKTREIIALTAWAGCTAMGGRVPNPWSLIAAPQQTHLDEIILALEEQPNLPGTITEHPNWRRRMTAPLEDLLADPDTSQRIDTLAAARKEPPAGW